MTNKKIDPLFVGFGIVFVLYTLSLLMNFLFNTVLYQEEFVGTPGIRLRTKEALHSFPSYR